MEKAFRSLENFSSSRFFFVFVFFSRFSVEGNNKAQFKHNARVSFRWLLKTECLCTPPPSSYAEALTPNVMLFGGEVYGR